MSAIQTYELRKDNANQSFTLVGFSEQGDVELVGNPDNETCLQDLTEQEIYQLVTGGWNEDLYEDYTDNEDDYDRPEALRARRFNDFNKGAVIARYHVLTGKVETFLD